MFPCFFSRRCHLWQWVISFFLFSACSHIIEQQPIDRLTDERFYVDSSSANAASTACYAPLAYEGGYQFALWAITDGMSDDALGYEEFEALAVRPTNELVYKLWSAHYTGIFRCNVVLQRLPAIEMRPQLKAQYLAEARFLRALYAFNLVRLFGDIPLPLVVTGDINNLSLPRQTTQVVHQQIERDLVASIPALPLSQQVEPGRATQGAALSLLANLYLTQRRWAAAAEVAEKTINLGVYRLEREYSTNFRADAKNGPECVFAVQFRSGVEGLGNWASDFQGAPGLQTGGYETNAPTRDSLLPPPGGKLTGGIVEAFEPGDRRKAVAVSNYGGLNPVTHQVQKFLIYKFFTGLTYNFKQSPLNTPVLRFAEVLLTLAEARNELQGGDDRSLEALNLVRQRAGLPAVKTKNQAQLREAIRHERRVELCFESRRWFDLLRYGSATTILQNQDPSINRDPRHTLLPIPQLELDRNRLLTQNPGY